MKPLVQTAIVCALLASPAAADGGAGAKGVVVQHELNPEPAEPTYGARADTYHGQTAGHVRRRVARDEVLFVSTQCPPNFNGMFRGTLYCMNGKTLP